jgi:hypothetical protein
MMFPRPKSPANHGFGALIAFYRIAKRKTALRTCSLRHCVPPIRLDPCARSFRKPCKPGQMRPGRFELPRSKRTTRAAISCSPIVRRGARAAFLSAREVSANLWRCSGQLASPPTPSRRSGRTESPFRRDRPSPQHAVPYDIRSHDRLVTAAASMGVRLPKQRRERLRRLVRPGLAPATAVAPSGATRRPGRRSGASGG